MRQRVYPKTFAGANSMKSMTYNFPNTTTSKIKRTSGGAFWHPDRQDPKSKERGYVQIQRLQGPPGVAGKSALQGCREGWTPSATKLHQLLKLSFRKFGAGQGMNLLSRLVSRMSVTGEKGGHYICLSRRSKLKWAGHIFFFATLQIIMCG